MMPLPSQVSERYRPDIDGLRAIAVLSVIGFHTFPHFVKGGFVGVDIFFVISGYLITGIVIDATKESRFSYLEFYKRRIKRLFPSLLTVVAASFIVGWYVLLPDEFRQFGKHLAGGAGFVTNFLLWSESGYFDQSSDTKPLLHLWSLAVEEQFYIFWPLLLGLVWRRNRGILLVTALVAAASFTYSTTMVAYDAVAAFYSPLSRFWELMVGSILAYVARQADQRNQSLQTIRGALGLLLIAGSVMMLRIDFAFPGYWALPPTLGTYLIISAGPLGWLNRQLVGNQLVASLGLISYPLYLWHWPILVFAKLLKGGLLTPAERSASVTLAVGLAYLTYRHIEYPLRQSKTLRVPQGLVYAAASVGLIGLAIFDGNLKSRLDSEQLAPILAAKVDWEYPPVAVENHSFGPLRYFTEASRLEGYTLFLGDSNMEQFAPRIDFAIRNSPERLNGAIFVGNQLTCNLMKEFISGLDTCPSARSELAMLIERQSTQAVAIAMSWLAYEADFAKSGNQQRLIDLLREITRSKRAYIILNIPSGDELSPANMFIGSRLGTLKIKPISSLTFDFERFEGRYATVNRILTEIARESGASTIDPVTQLCPNRFCPIFDNNGKPLYLDTSHLTRSYATKAATFIDEALTPVRIDPE
jgi:peptidoglycan/LPS O-acetylase OafA/YrhL